MIRITVEMVPKGVGPPRVMGRMTITNDGTGSDSIGNYITKLFSRNRKTPFRIGEVKSFPRNQKNVWHLIQEGLKEIYER